MKNLIDAVDREALYGKRPRRVINTARSEDPAQYAVKPANNLPEPPLREMEDRTIATALAILGGRLRQPGQPLDTPSPVKQYLRIQLADLDHEVFCVLFLDVKNRLIACEEMFRGTLTTTSVYPREVVKAALKHNAAAVILAHNHPSGVSEPSQSDLLITRALTQALALVDVRVLDHFIVAGADVHSFADSGQI